MAKKRKKAPTSDQLRIAIDSGAGRDKVAFPDPAAAPLGSDDEAAGFPPGSERRALAAETEIGRGDAEPRSTEPDTARLALVLFSLLLVAAVFLVFAGPR